MMKRLIAAVVSLAFAVGPIYAQEGRAVGPSPPWSNSQLTSMATTTIKGQTVGGSGAPVDLTAAQAAAIIGSVGGALKSKVISTTKDMTQASGNVAYTGFGFQPTSCLAFTTNSTASIASGYISLGFSDGALTSASLFFFSSGATVGANLITLVDATVANDQTATVVSYDADGLTLAWVKTGSPTGTATVKFMCFR